MGAREFGTLRLGDIRNEVDRRVSLDPSQSFARLALQRITHRALWIMDLHNRRPTLPDTAQVTLLNGAIKRAHSPSPSRTKNTNPHNACPHPSEQIAPCYGRFVSGGLSG